MTDYANNYLDRLLLMEDGVRRNILKTTRKTKQ